ncbi:hypothetical protein JR338_07555 [Chloroflexota bacterium]|nr:hypothetical protein JR338_07555 [Chloroflexota bacterium]
MKLRVLFTGLTVILLATLLIAPISDVNAQDDTPPSPTPASVEVVNEYFTVSTYTTRDGTSLTAAQINGPSEPPDLAAWEASRVSSLDRAAGELPGFPAYTWVYGCSAVSGAMIAGYYDNNGYGNLYTGPTNGGVMPLVEDPSWGTWTDSESVTYPNNPLVASHKGVDGLSGNGSIDDYWVAYNVGSTPQEPWGSSGIQHDWDTAIGDYMMTSQWAYGNVDGSTTFYNYTDGSRLPCALFEQPEYEDFHDGNAGQKHFYEARGYTVTECFNQYIENYNGNEYGFTLEDFQSEIDAGHPVMIQLEGHTVVGFGYDGSTIYIRDTWDSSIHSLPWGGYYSTMRMYAVSVIQLEEAASSFSKTSPANASNGINPNSAALAWEENNGAQSYEYCINTSASCSSWVNVGTNRTAALTPLTGGETYYWQVRANMGTPEPTYANGAEGEFWSFTTFDPSLLTESNYIPLMAN